MRVAEDGPVVVPTFRRLFATGHTRYPGAVVRIDVGFELAPRRRNRPTYGPVHPRELALSCLTVPVRVPGALRTPVELMTVRSGLAQRLLTVTTSLTAVPGHVDRWWISAGCPLVLVEAPYRPGDLVSRARFFLAAIGRRDR